MAKDNSNDGKIRDLNVTKECETCGKSYHPRKNGYQATSKFCSAECTRKRRKFSW
jgi:hypothetical protein